MSLLLVMICARTPRGENIATTVGRGEQGLRLAPLVDAVGRSRVEDDDVGAADGGGDQRRRFPARRLVEMPSLRTTSDVLRSADHPRSDQSPNSPPPPRQASRTFPDVRRPSMRTDSMLHIGWRFAHACARQADTHSRPQPQEQMTSQAGFSTLMHLRRWCRRQPYMGGHAAGIVGPVGPPPRPRRGEEPLPVQATPSNLLRCRPAEAPTSPHTVRVSRLARNRATRSPDPAARAARVGW